jgi:hypothetical protein
MFKIWVGEKKKRSSRERCRLNRDQLDVLAAKDL